MRDQQWKTNNVLLFGDQGDTSLHRTGAGLIGIGTGEGSTPAIIPTTFTVDMNLLAASVAQWIYIAPRACKVVSVKEVHSVVGGASATVRPRKITDTSAPGASASATVTEITTAAISLTSTINTIQSGTLSATPADYTLAAGDKIALNFAGTLTGLVGYIVIELQAI